MPSIYYLEADIVLAGLIGGREPGGAGARNGAEIDAWTVDADRPWLREMLRLLIAAGCDQITTNDSEALAPLVAEIAPWS